MPTGGSLVRALLAGAVCLLLYFAAAASALAGAPATVTVRVEGASQTLIGATQLTTTTAPVVKDGNTSHSCSGTSAAGALELASGGQWTGEWFSGLGYAVVSIKGESYPFSGSNYWSFWVDNKPASKGICETELSPGDSLLFFPDCFSEEAGKCPPSPNPLGITAPASADTNSPVSVTVISYANSSGAPSPAVGATVSGPGSSATTDSSGHATLNISTTGTVTLSVRGANSVRAETTLCMHNGNDGNCATTPPAPSTAPAPAPPPVNPAPSPAPKPYTGPYAIVAAASGIIDGHLYARGNAPRLLAGTITSQSQVKSVSLRLRRTWHGRCWAFRGASERLARVRCREGAFFQLSVGGSSFSYLLPFKLPPGRYVLDIAATDTAGNHTRLARGRSRIVFYVR